MRTFASPLLALLGAFALGACTSATSDTAATTTIAVGAPPFLGLVVRANDLFNDVGCGTGPDNVAKYVAVVAGADGVDIDGRIYDCFADANFFNLPTVDDSQRYTVKIFAYSQPDYDARRSAIFAAERSSANQAAQSPRYTTSCVGDLIAVEGIAICDPLTSAL